MVGQPLHTSEERLTNLYLLVVPAVHTERLDFCDMRADFAVERSAAHAQEDAQLLLLACFSSTFDRGCEWKEKFVEGIAQGTHAPARPS